MPFKDVDTVRFHYELLGDKSHPPLVLISGYTSDLNAWRNVAEALKDKFYALIFDNQGIGQTTDEGQPLTIEMMANNIKGLIDALGLKNPSIIGFAMGSAIAQTIAYRFPDDVSQLILLGSLMKFSQQAKALCEQLCALREAGKFTQYAQVIYETCFSDTYQKIHSRESMVDALIQLLPTSQTANGQRRQVEALKDFDSTAWANQIDVETVVISPEWDQFSTPAEGKMLAEMVKRGKQMMISDCGHAVLDEKLDDVINVLRRELR